LHGPGGGWFLPPASTVAAGVLDARGGAASAGARLDALTLAPRSADAAPLPERYLSGWLGVAGLAGLRMAGGLDVDLVLADGALQVLDLRPRALDLAAPGDRFRFDRLDGRARRSEEHTSELQSRGHL